MRRLVCAATAVVFALSISSSVAHAQTSGFRSSTQKYREKNPGGKGRSGGATLAARMLYAKNGTTLLEVTTGEFDSAAAASGDLTKVRASSYDANGLEIFSFNYNQLSAGSYFRQTYSGLSPGQPFTVQGHVRSDAKRNSSVVVTTTVQKRPDLFAERIIVPARVPVNIPVQIVGVISELNGQVGARTECVLYADDVEIDRSSAIWVDSGDSVSCAFSPTFATVGIANLKLKAESVVPGDWDMANNVAERSIEVLSLTPEFDVAYAEGVDVDMNNTTFRQLGRYVNSTVTAGYDWFYEETIDRDSDAFVYSGAAVEIPYVPSLISATATDDSGGGWTVQRQVPGCFDYAVGRANGRSFYTYVTGCGNLYVEDGSYAGMVTYASRLLTRTFHVVAGTVAYDGPAQYILNNVSTEIGDGENLLHGSVWTIDVAVVVGPFTFNAPVSVPLNQAFDAGESQPYVCESIPNAVACNSSSWRVAGRSGAGGFVRQQP